MGLVITGRPVGPRELFVYSTERHVGICRQHNPVRAAARHAVGVGRRIVVGVDDRFDQRTLAIRYDVGIVCRDSDRGRRRHSLTQREQ